MFSQLDVNNPYYKIAKNDFLDYTAKKESMELDFHPDLIDEYNLIKKKIIASAIELLKLGAEFELDNESGAIEIIVDNDMHAISVSEIKSFMTEEQFDQLISNRLENPVYSNDSYGEYKTVVEPAQNSSDPLTALMQMFGNLNSPKDNLPAKKENVPSNNNGLSGLLSDIANFQKKVILLEQERNIFQTNSITLKEKNEKLKRALDDKDLHYEEEKEKIAAMNAELNERITELEFTTNEAINTQNNLSDQIKEKESAIADLSSALEKKGIEIEHLKDERDRLNNELKGARDEYISYKALTDNELVSLRNYKNETNNKINQLNQKNDSLNKQLENCNGKIKELDNIKASESRLKNELNQISSELEQERKKTESLKKQLENVNTEEVTTLRKQIDEILKEKELKEKELEELQNKQDQISVELANTRSQKEEYRNKAENLEELAFNDAKTGTKNLNAFNNDFKEIDKNNTILAIITISGLKSINANWGRKSGDKVISQVAEELCSTFKNNDIYRIMGDQFIILFKNISQYNYNSIQGELSDIRRKLANDSISIAYGVIAGDECDTNADMLSQAEKRVAEMKSSMNGNGSKQYSEIQQKVSPLNVVKRDNNTSPQDVSIDEKLMSLIEED